MTTIRLLCSMLAVSVLGSVVGDDSDSFWEKAETEPYMDDSSLDERDDEIPPRPWCGRVQNGVIAPGRKRSSNSDDDWDDLDKFGVSRYTVPGEVPWLVNIRFNAAATRRCGGAIINEYWVLTSASCVRCFRKRKLRLVVGDYSLTYNDTGEQAFKIGAIYIHGFFDADFRDYNIALLKVQPVDNHGILFNHYVQPICLPVASEYPYDGQFMTISGWNDYWRPGFHDQMRLGRIEAISLDECRQTDNGTWQYVSDRMICTGEGGFNVRVSENLYGGPVTTKQGAFQHFLIGIISHSSGCQERCRVYTFVTSVASYLPWIHNIINSNSNDDEKIIFPRPSRYFINHRHQSELSPNDTYITYGSY